jgi:hypothetical protein
MRHIYTHYTLFVNVTGFEIKGVNAPKFLRYAYISELECSTLVFWTRSKITEEFILDDNSS